MPAPVPPANSPAVLFPTIPSRLFLPASIAVFLTLAAGLWFYTVDDAFITYRYARNIADGQGVVFNGGERVEGFSSPAWLLPATLALLANINPANFSKILSILAVVLLLFKMDAWACRSAPLGRSAILLLAAHVPLVAGAVCGLESAANAVIVALLILSAVDEPKNWRAMALYGVLALLIRPENALFLALHAAARLCIHRPEFRSVAKTLIAWAFAAAVLTLTRRLYFGQWLPNTAAAKLVHDASLTDFAASYIRTWVTAHTILITLAALAWLDPRSRLIALHATIITISQAAFVFIAGGDWMPQWRFLLPAGVALTIAAAAGLDAAARRLIAFAQSARQSPSVSRIRLVVPAAVFIIAIMTTFAHYRPLRWSLEYTRRQHAALESGLVAVLRERLAPDQCVAARDVGLLGYGTHGRVLDLVGLTDAHIARSSGMHGRQRLDCDYVFARAPRFIVVQSEQDRAGIIGPDRLARRLAHDKRFNEYERIGRWDLPGRHFCELYEWHATPIARSAHGGDEIFGALAAE